MEGNTSGAAAHPSVTPQFKQTTADDLLEAYAEEPISKEQEIVSEAEKQAKIQLEIPKQVAAEKIVKKLEESEEAPQEAPSDEEGGERALEAKTSDGGEAKIPLDAELTHEYPNGKVAKFKIEDAVKAYVEKDSFNREADRRNYALSQREKALQTQVNEIVANAKSVTEQFLQGNVIESIASLARMSGKNSGQDPVELMRNALNATIKVADTWSKLTPEQQELFIEKQRAEEYKRAFQRETQQVQAIQQQKQVQARVAAICKELRCGEEDFMASYEDLLQLVGPDKKFKAAEDIQPENVAHYIRFQQGLDKAKVLADEVAPGLGGDSRLVEQVAFLLANDATMTDNDIRDVIRYVQGKSHSPAVENLNRKVQTTKAAGLRTQLSEVSSPKKQEEDELTEELEQFFLGRRYR